MWREEKRRRRDDGPRPFNLRNVAKNVCMAWLTLTEGKRKEGGEEGMKNTLDVLGANTPSGLLCKVHLRERNAADPDRPSEYQYKEKPADCSG
jgi:hypothetical protein